MKNTKKYGYKSAFTLAEVLITLVIIGVIASLTMPVFITKWQARALETQRKKAVSTLTNGFRLLMVEDSVTNMKNTNMPSCNYDKPCIANEIKRVFNVAMDNISENDIFSTIYTIPQNNDEQEVWVPEKYVFTTTDGVIVKIGSINPDGRINFLVDVNGAKKPNIAGKDLCFMWLSPDGKVKDVCDDGQHDRWPLD